jgi:CubicO group peptidase (beta-lactamase class C family)
MEVYHPNAPGVSVLIAKGEQIIYERQIGLANLENDVAIDASSLFSVGSITKQFTAAAILQLEAKHQLQLTDRVVKYLPKMAKAIPEVTIKQLIQHTSGVPDYPRIKGVRQMIRNEPSVEELIRLALMEGSVFSPGTDYQYSNTGYLLLGKVIAAISGQTFEAYLLQHILKPAGMENSDFTSFTTVLPRRTTPYTYDEDLGILRATPHAYSSAAGGLWSNPKELLQWMKALRAGKIIPPAGLRQMFSATNPTEASPYYGWEANEVAGHLSYEHTGFEPGYKASSIYLPAEDIYLIAVQNTENSSPTPPLIKAAALCLGKPYPAAEVSLSDIGLMGRFVGRYSFSEGKERIVRLENGKLSYLAPGGLPRPLYLLDSLTLFFGDGYRQLIMESASGDKPSRLTYRNRRYTETGQLISKEVSTERRAIILPPATLAQFTGQYQTEHFLMDIMLEGGQLYAQPEGSDRLPLTAYADRKFYIQEIGAELEFKATDGIWSEVCILLEGDLHVGKRR